MCKYFFPIIPAGVQNMDKNGIIFRLIRPLPYVTVLSVLKFVLSHNFVILFEQGSKCASVKWEMTNVYQSSKFHLEITCGVGWGPDVVTAD